jgi:hypothetical protein
MDEATPHDPFSRPPALPLAPEVQVAPAPAARRRRGPVVAVIAAVALVAAVVGIGLAMRGGGGDSYSLKNASAAAAQADKVAFEMNLDAMGASMTMDARIDTEQNLMAMSAELPTMDAGSAIDIVIDIGNQQMLMDASAFPLGAAQVPTKWVGIDLSKVPGVEDQFGSLTGTSPLDTAKLFETADAVQEVGIEELDGESTKHYLVTVDLAKAMAAQPGVFDQLGEVSDALPDTIDYDVWVTEDNQLRKLAFSLEMLGETLTLEMRVTAIGDIEPIVVPSPDEVTDISDMLGG